MKPGLAFVGLAVIVVFGALIMTLESAAGDSPSDSAPGGTPNVSEEVARRFAKLALDCVHREYPNKIAHVMQSDEDAKPPRELTPVFYGCFDWHSAVHGHWLLARLARLFPESDFAPAGRAALDRSLTPEKIASEVGYLQGEGRTTFERPYGLAWLLQLAAELREWGRDDDQVRRWASTLEPLERTAEARLREWLPKLSHPIRTGEHSQTAFAFGLALDWARERDGDNRDEPGDRDNDEHKMTELLENRIRELYMADRDCPLAYEPSGQDFLSPCLAEADLLRRVLGAPAFAAWLGGFLPDLPLDGSSGWLTPAVVTDPTDGKLVHLDGLNLSRAWMLEGIAAGLPTDDPRVAGLRAAASEHASSGLASVSAENYEGGHWLGSFAVYLVTRRGAGGPD
jgi:hypothetical protein